LGDIPQLIQPGSDHGFVGESFFLFAFTQSKINNTMPALRKDFLHKKRKKNRQDKQTNDTTTEGR